MGRIVGKLELRLKHIGDAESSGFRKLLGEHIRHHVAMNITPTAERLLRFCEEWSHRLLHYLTDKDGLELPAGLPEFIRWRWCDRFRLRRRSMD